MQIAPPTLEFEGVSAGFRAGGVDYVVKPFQADEVLSRVATHLRLNRLTRELLEKNHAQKKTTHTSGGERVWDQRRRRARAASYESTVYEVFVNSPLRECAAVVNVIFVSVDTQGHCAFFSLL